MFDTYLITTKFEHILSEDCLHFRGRRAKILEYSFCLEVILGYGHNFPFFLELI